MSNPHPHNKRGAHGRFAANDEGKQPLPQSEQQLHNRALFFSLFDDDCIIQLADTLYDVAMNAEVKATDRQVKVGLKLLEALMGKDTLQVEINQKPQFTPLGERDGEKE